MSQLYKLIALLLLVGFCVPSYAAVDDVELISCSVFSDSDDKKEGEKKGEKEGGKKGGDEEEEPDCE